MVIDWIDIFINEFDIKQNKFVMDVNYFGVLNCVKSVEKYFKDKKNGHISIVSSIAGYRGLPNSSGYGPSKAALNNFAESIFLILKNIMSEFQWYLPDLSKHL